MWTSVRIPNFSEIYSLIETFYENVSFFYCPLFNTNAMSLKTNF